MLFGYIKLCHFFDYYLDEFYNHFFPDIDLCLLKQKYAKELLEKNEKLFRLNLGKIKEIKIKINSKSLFGFKERDIERINKEVEELFHMKIKNI